MHAVRDNAQCANKKGGKGDFKPVNIIIYIVQSDVKEINAYGCLFTSNDAGEPLISVASF